MLGQLQDAGNTTTLAHYLDLLQSAGLLAGLSKYAGQRVRQRASSPELLVLNTALMKDKTIIRMIDKIKLFGMRFLLQIALRSPRPNEKMPSS